MKKLFALVMIGCVLGTLEAAVRTEGAQLGEWTQDVDAAQTLAKAKGKCLLMNFTGSDWCCWCQLMDKRVFSSPGWVSWAKDHLALAFVDTPQNQGLVPEKYRSRNRDLCKKYKVSGFPTFIVFAPDGRELGRLGASPTITDASFITNVTTLIIKDKK